MTQPGVDYRPLPGARSLAGNAHGKPAQPFNPAIDPWGGGRFDRSKMAGRYGQYWDLGVNGPHDSSYHAYLTDQFAERRARWGPRYDEFDGKPTAREVNDAYYTADRRVLPLPPQPPPPPPPTPQPPPPEPPPAPVPEPPPPTPQPPPVTPPGLSSVEQSVRELVEQLDAGAAHLNIPWRAAWQTWKKLGLVARALSHAVRIKRRLLDDQSPRDERGQE